MNLVFYSNFNKEENATVDSEVVKLISNSKSRFTFIPSQTDTTRRHFIEFKDYYSSLGFGSFECFDVDTEFAEDKLADLLSSDVIFLSGGNTFYFLDRIKAVNIDSILVKFARTPGKTLVGVSAGAMIMTPTIMNTVIQHKLKGDFKELNKNDISDFSGLNLVDFEFVPHFSVENKGRMVKEYLPQTTNTIYGCPDGSGIIISNGKMKLIGDVIRLK